MPRKKKRPPADKERQKLRIQCLGVSMETVLGGIKFLAETHIPDEYVERVLDALDDMRRRNPSGYPEVFLEIEVEKPEGQLVNSPSGADEIPSKHSDEEQNYSSTS